MARADGSAPACTACLHNRVAQLRLPDKQDGINERVTSTALEQVC